MKNIEKNHLFKNLSVVMKSFKINFLFWIISVICIISITEFSDDKSYANSFITYILAMLLGWYIHYLSHAYDLLEMYKNANNRVIHLLKKNEYVDTIMMNLIKYTTDFHDKIHHNTKINKEPFNLIWETFQNFLMEGGLLILFSKYFNFKIQLGNHVFKFNKAILLLWGLLYATVHNINYIFLGCEQHVNHHKNVKTNYGIDMLDILFDTKYDINNIEDINHGALNLLIITLVIIYFKIYID
jgi:hypothetical protein